jgi:hypothetical protein
LTRDKESSSQRLSQYLRVEPVALVNEREVMVPVVTLAVPMVAVPIFEVEAFTVEELKP